MPGQTHSLPQCAFFSCKEKIKPIQSWPMYVADFPIIVFLDFSWNTGEDKSQNPNPRYNRRKKHELIESAMCSFFDAVYFLLWIFRLLRSTENGFFVLWRFLLKQRVVNMGSIKREIGQKEYLEKCESWFMSTRGCQLWSSMSPISSWSLSTNHNTKFNLMTHIEPNY